MCAKTSGGPASVRYFLCLGALGALGVLSRRVHNAIAGHPPYTSATEWAAGALCGFCGGIAGVVLAALVIRRRKPWKPHRLAEIAGQH